MAYGFSRYVFSRIKNPHRNPFDGRSTNNLPRCRILDSGIGEESAIGCDFTAHNPRKSTFVPFAPDSPDKDTQSRYPSLPLL